MYHLKIKIFISLLVVVAVAHNSCPRRVELNENKPELSRLVEVL